MGIHHELHAGVIDDFFVVFDIRIVHGDMSEALRNRSIGFFHDVRLVNGSDFLRLCIFLRTQKRRLQFSYSLFR